MVATTVDIEPTDVTHPCAAAGDQVPAAAGLPQPDAPAFGDDGAIDPRRVRLFRGPRGVLRCTIEGEKTILRAKVVRAFPLSNQMRWINILDWKNKEVCLIEDAGGLDPESRRLVYEELERQYRHAVIERIHRIDNEYRTLYWDVETNRGRREFAMKWSADTILWLSDTTMMLVDVDTNRFVIPDIGALDRESRRRLEIVL